MNVNRRMHDLTRLSLAAHLRSEHASAGVDTLVALLRIGDFKRKE
jgi:hypothetical protein